MRQLRAVVLAAALAAIFVARAEAQAVLQGNVPTAGNGAMYVPTLPGQPGPAVLQDEGPPGNFTIGQGRSGTLQVNRTPGAGPGGTHNCFYDTTSLTVPFHYMCLDANTGSGAEIVVGSGGGASPLGLNLVLNGTTYALPSTGSGNVNGPASGISTQDIAVYNSAPAGTVITNGAGNIRGTITTPILTSGSMANVISDSRYFPDSLIGSNVNYQALAAVAHANLGGTITNTIGLGAYVLNDNEPGGSSANAVALYGWGQSNVSGAWTWGINTIINSKSGVGGTHLYNEIDENAENSADVLIGLLFAGASTVTPSSSTGIVFAPLGSGVPWGTAYYTEPGAATIGMQLSPVAASGSNIDSQPIYFNAFNASGVTISYIVQASATSLDFLTTASTQAFQFNGDVVITGSHNLIANGNTGLNCSGTPSSSFATTNGVVTHC